MNRMIVAALYSLAIAANAATLGLPTLALPPTGLPPATLPAATPPEVSTAQFPSRLSLPALGPLSSIVPSLLPADLLALTTAPVTAILPVTPALPTAAPCRFGGGSVELNFGQVPTNVDARLYSRQLMLQVECSQATEFMISSQEPPLSVGTMAERSAIVVMMRDQAGIYSGQAWAFLEQDGQPLATRHFSVPAASPTLIAVTALLLASPESRRTPALSGQLESLALARQLYLIEAATP